MSVGNHSHANFNGGRLSAIDDFLSSRRCLTFDSCPSSSLVQCMDERDLKQDETEHQTETQNSHRHHPYHKRGILKKKNRTLIRHLIIESLCLFVTKSLDYNFENSIKKFAKLIGVL